jgi:hypothetical protein
MYMALEGRSIIKKELVFLPTLSYVRRQSSSLPSTVSTLDTTKILQE